MEISTEKNDFAFEKEEKEEKMENNKSFSSSPTPFAFPLIILDDLESVPIEEFRLEKETTSEFLQLRQMSREESAKIDEACNIEEPEAYKK
ncbi:hypothetical protein DdX_08406 [Ditylenchus destructor]|uniref:Uncharacterized protein n=1 Tax=Ditylenchus destructor TaxID=166010 RepID=A0AAD4N7A7_9BILA|nr:hypothetical protein DdX_08406 [Ditylenchus destructor]